MRKIGRRKISDAKNELEWDGLGCLPDEGGAVVTGFESAEDAGNRVK